MKAKIGIDYCEPEWFAHLTKSEATVKVGGATPREITLDLSALSYSQREVLNQRLEDLAEREDHRWDPCWQTLAGFVGKRNTESLGGYWAEDANQCQTIFRVESFGFRDGKSHTYTKDQGLATEEKA